MSTRQTPSLILVSRWPTAISGFIKPWLLVFRQRHKTALFRCSFDSFVFENRAAHLFISIHRGIKQYLAKIPVWYGQQFADTFFYRQHCISMSWKLTSFGHWPTVSTDVQFQERPDGYCIVSKLSSLLNYDGLWLWWFLVMGLQREFSVRNRTGAGQSNQFAR